MSSEPKQDIIGDSDSTDTSTIATKIVVQQEDSDESTPMTTSSGETTTATVPVVMSTTNTSNKSEPILNSNTNSNSSTNSTTNTSSDDNNDSTEEQHHWLSSTAEEEQHRQRRSASFTTVRHESVIRSTASSQLIPQSTTNSFLITNSSQHHSFHPQNNPFSKTMATTGGQQSSVSTSTTASGGGGGTGTGLSAAVSDSQQQQTDRSSVILAPARLALNTQSVSTLSANNTSNNYFSNNFGNNSSTVLAESRLSSTATTSATHNRPSLLRPSVLRVADSSTNNSMNAQRDGKTFAFVSLSKEDITRPATTLLQSDTIIRCGADTTSAFNGTAEEGASHPLQPSMTTLSAVTSTSAISGGEQSSLQVPQPPSPPSFASTGNSMSSDADDSNSQSEGFVFGKNLAERAVFVNKKNKNSESDMSGVDAERSGVKKRLRVDESVSADSITGVEHNGRELLATVSGPSTSGATPVIDSVIIKPNSDGVLDLSSTASTDSSPEKDNKRKYEVITGEEDEQNVLSMHCRLYAWETDTSSWKERGRGCLRLNDVIKDDKLCSRIVMRTSGALRVILNAHLLSGMRFDMSNENCLRFTNVDGIYLIKGAPKDIDQLNSAIDYRLREISKRHKSNDSETDASPKQQTIEDMSNDSWNQAISTQE